MGSSNDQVAVNPKAAEGQKKPALHLIPGAALVEVARAMQQGAYFSGPNGTGYGPYNWRVTSIAHSTYMGAALRHVYQHNDGEDFDPETKERRVRHVALAIAGLLVLLDSILQGTAVDDRPAKARTGEIIRAYSKGEYPLEGWGITCSLTPAISNVTLTSKS